jgi:hypothetical protein
MLKPSFDLILLDKKLLARNEKRNKNYTYRH